MTYIMDENPQLKFEDVKNNLLSKEKVDNAKIYHPSVCRSTLAESVEILANNEQ